MKESALQVKLRANKDYLREYFECLNEKSNLSWIAKMKEVSLKVKSATIYPFISELLENKFDIFKVIDEVSEILGLGETAQNVGFTANLFGMYLRVTYAENY